MICRSIRVNLKRMKSVDPIIRIFMKRKISAGKIAASREGSRWGVYGRSAELANLGYLDVDGA